MVSKAEMEDLGKIHQIQSLQSEVERLEKKCQQCQEYVDNLKNLTIFEICDKCYSKHVESGYNPASPVRAVNLDGEERKALIDLLTTEIDLHGPTDSKIYVGILENIRISGSENPFRQKRRSGK